MKALAYVCDFIFLLISYSVFFFFFLTLCKSQLIRYSGEGNKVANDREQQMEQNASWLHTATGKYMAKGKNMAHGTKWTTEQEG